MKDGSLYEVMQAAFFTLMSNVHTAIPGRIVSYDRTTRLAEVQPIIKKRLELGSYEETPVIQSVPVIWPGTVDAVIHLPLHQGDGCLILFSERSMDAWIEARSTDPINADDIRRFSLVDAVCIPGLAPPQVAIEPAQRDDAIELIYKGKSIVISETEIDLGGSSKAFVTHGELNTALQTFIAALNLHVHGAAGTPPVTPMSLNIASAATSGVKCGG